jgi:hypothetical protein
MLKQAYTPPETKYEVHIDELMKAIRGEDFVQGNGLYRIWGGDIPENELFDQDPFTLWAQQEYVILTKTKLTGEANIEIYNINSNPNTLAFIIYKSIILPSINLRDTTTGHWDFYHSKTGDINIEKNSVVGHIDIRKGCEVGSISINRETKTSNITIRNSQAKFISITTKSEVGNIMVTENSQSEHIIVTNSKAGSIRVTQNSNSNDIMIIESSLSGLIHITGISKIENISVNNSNVGEIKLDKDSQSLQIKVLANSKTGNIEIADNSHSDSITIQDSSVTGDISINKNREAMSISVTGNSQTGNLSLTDALLSQVEIQHNYFGLSLYNTEVQLMKIIDSFITEVDFQTGIKGELYVTKSRVLHLRVANTALLKESVLSLSDTEVQYCVLEEVLTQGSLLLRKLRPLLQVFEWRNIKDYLGEEPADDWKKELWSSKKELLTQQADAYHKKTAELAQRFGATHVFRISNSSLGETEITGCDLTGYKFEYYNSKLLDCFITGTQLPKDNIAVYNPVAPGIPVEKPDEYEQKTSIYNQIKKIYENQGDVVETSWYHSKAMENQQALLKLMYKAEHKPWCKKVLGEKSFNLFGFRLNRFSNNHGESWRRAILFVLLGSGIMYSLYYLSIHYHEPFGFGAIGRFFGDYFSFLDITHRIDFHVPKEQLNGWSKFLDYSGKLVIGYGLYQLIAAFRRHGKKAG